MKRMVLLSLAVAATLVGGFGCKKKGGASAAPGLTDRIPQDPPNHYVVAMVNGTPLSWGDMNARAMGFLKDEVDTNHLIIPSNRLEEAKSYFRHRAINTFVFKTVMMDEARKQNIRTTEVDRREGLLILANTLKARNWTTNDFFLKGPLGEAAMRREFDDGLVIDKLLRSTLRDGIKVDDKEIMGAIQFIGATNDLRKAKLEDVRKRLLAGANFEETAKAISEDPSAPKGGDMGEFARGKLLKPLEAAAFSQKVGEIGKVVETGLGYHIVKVSAHTPSKAATASTPAIPETVHAAQILIKRIPVDRKRIAESIVKTKYDAAVRRYYAELKAKSKIECFLYSDMKF